MKLFLSIVLEMENNEIEMDFHDENTDIGMLDHRDGDGDEYYRPSDDEPKGDVGAYGSEGDSSVFFRSEFGYSIIDDSIELPEDTHLGSIRLPFVFVADDTFPLVDRIMKPFTPPRRGHLTDAEFSTSTKPSSSSC